MILGNFGINDNFEIGKNEDTDYYFGRKEHTVKLL